MFRRPHYIALGAVALLAVIVLNLPRQASAQLKVALGSMFLPLFGLAGSSHQLAQKTGDAITPRKTLVEQLNQLHKENQELRARAVQDDTVWRENDRLRTLVGFQQQSRWKLKLARVVSREPANWWRTLTIDRGSRDGVTTNQTVITTDGLVGRIGSTTWAHSQVILLGDPNCRVAAVVADTRDQGIISPSSSPSLDPTIVDLTYLANISLLHAGQRVQTSGIGGVFPAGIVIGDIADTRSVGYGLYTEARVKLAVNLNRLEEVWVILQ